jgi:hypothetical protein
MVKTLASEIRIKKIRVSLVLKGKDIRFHRILGCLRPSLELEGPDGRCRTLVMSEWNECPRKTFDTLVLVVKRLSGDKASSSYLAARAIWKKMKTAIYCKARRKSTRKRYEAAYRKAYRTVLLNEIKSSLTALSKKSIAAYIRPKDLADVWKSLQGEKMIEDIHSS